MIKHFLIVGLRRLQYNSYGPRHFGSDAAVACPRKGFEVDGCIWVVVKIMVPFWVPIIIRHLIFRVPQKGP